jgi:hypothetical protein
LRKGEILWHKKVFFFLHQILALSGSDSYLEDVHWAPVCKSVSPYHFCKLQMTLKVDVTIESCLRTTGSDDTHSFVPT